MPFGTFKLSTSTQCPVDLNVATLIWPLWAPEKPAKEEGAEGTPRLAPNHGLDALEGWLGYSVYTLAQEEGFAAGCCKLLSVALPPKEGKHLKRIIFVGLGEAKEASLAKLQSAFTGAFKKALSWDKALHQRLAVDVPAPYTLWGGSLRTDESAATEVGTATISQALVEALYQATYRSLEAKKAPYALDEIVLLSQNEAAAQQGIALGQALGHGKALTQDLVNLSSKKKCTLTLEEAALELAKAFPSITATVQNNPAWVEKEMPCFFEVARASVDSDPPRFIHLTYKGAKPSRNVALVGKGVIFDTGGYQVKPGDSMVTMKGDMAGAASVLGTFRALAEMAPEHLEVHGYIATTPNKIAGSAMLPDSIVNTRCGKTVEIRHTDAEGRLTLIDAVTFAAEQKPEAVVTIATLTGAAMVAVGRTTALMGSHPTWRGWMETAAHEAGEPVQALDVTLADVDNIHSKLEGADIRNTNRGKYRGAQTAMAFILQGLPKTLPFVHLDIAGADMTDDERATGYPVGTLLHGLLALKP